jgi:hypothetical protein
MWTGMNITANAQSGTTAVFTYNSLTGLALAVGRALTITGMTNAGNNKTIVITSFTGTTSGTITCTLATGVTESGSSGVVTKASTVPTTGNYKYEIWTPNDGLTAFYAKVEYGMQGTNAPAVRLSLSTTTDGAGTCTGYVAGPYITCKDGFTVPSTSTQYNCNFSGAAGRFGAMLWTNAPTSGNPQCPPQFFAIERSVDNTGAYTNSYVTMWTHGYCNSGSGSYQMSGQRSVVFGVGAGPDLPPAVAAGRGGWVMLCYNTGGSQSFNGYLPFATCQPVIPYPDYPCTMVGVGSYTDYVDGLTFQVTLYGSTRTYIAGKNPPLDRISPGNTGVTWGEVFALLMRFD